MIYGCETWSISVIMEKRLKCVENWCLRRKLKTQWCDHVSHEDLWLRTGAFSSKPDLLPTIIKRQLSFIGHIVRSDGLERSILLGHCGGR